MFCIALQSGSNGNCIYVESGDTRLLFDAGISGSRAEERLAEFGRDIRSVDALIISHDHADHVRCAGIFQRKFHLPVYVTEATFDAALRRCDLGTLTDVRHFRPGDTLSFDGVAVETVPTPHDGADGAAFVVSNARRRLGILTDLGHVFDGLGPVLASLDAVLLESNYDPEMLEVGPYPHTVKQRIRGPGGHLSNVEAAELLLHAASPRLRWACLSHLSETNNSPDLALATHRTILAGGPTLYAASRRQATPLPKV